MDEIILHFDAASRNVGWCVGQGETLLDSGAFRATGSPDERVASIVRWAVTMIERWDPDVVSIEDPTPDRGNRKTDRLLARVCGNLEGVARAAGIRAVVWIHPMAVKATGFSKDRLQAAANLAGKDDVGPDEADAIGGWMAAVGEIQAQRFAARAAEVESYV